VLKKLERFIKRNGLAYTAYRLGFNDTPVIKAWIKRQGIPKKHLLTVKAILGQRKVSNEFIK
jgi:hypothetical protein